PQTTEFGAKVGLLAGLTVMSPLRYLLERWLDRSGFTPDSAGGDKAPPTPATVPVLLARGAILGAALVLLATVVVAAGGPARPSTSAALDLPTVDVSGRLPALPLATVEHGEELSVLLGEVTVDEFTTMLAEDLAIENAATSSGDGRILLLATTGQRTLEREQALDLAVSDGVRFTSDYHIDSLRIRPLERDGSQTGAAIAVAVTGTVEVITTDPSGGERNRRTEPLDGDLVLRQGADGRWLIAHHLPAG
ncbi:MAG: hypothetical protein OER95_11840, partial [Acidimicrobiia bacterium]|nr:hypothetical protein [Acidimicrobiia bacterium]